MDDRPESEFEQQFRRLFSIEEANETLPLVTPLLLRLKQDKEQFDQLRRSLDAITPAMQGNGHGAVAVDYERRINDLVTSMSEGIRTLAEQGIEVKDLNQGLIDFPHLRGGRVVYLCWRLGEGEIAYWHELDTGYAGRQELNPPNDPFSPPFSA
jgi:hypothetical protein